MARTNDLQPPIDAGVEILTVGFDFTDDLAAGEVINSVVMVDCDVASGTPDPGAASRLIGTPTIVASALGLPNAAVAQQFGNCVAGAVYRLQCVVLTSLGNQPSLWSHFECVEPA